MPETLDVTPTPIAVTDEQIAPIAAKMTEYWVTWAKQHTNGEAMLNEIRTVLGR